MKITKLQNEHYNSIKWLLDGNNGRRIGKSSLMALVFIEIALKNRGQWIEVYDHFPTFMAKNLMIQKIKDLIKIHVPETAMKNLEITQTRFRIN